jgi:hypothetical protein
LKSERSNNWLSTKKLESMYVVRNINDVFKEIFLK